jgi:hypothetical protein
MATCTFKPLQDLAITFERKLTRSVGKPPLVPIYIVHLMVRAHCSRYGWYRIELQRVPTLEEANEARISLYQTQLRNKRLLSGWASVLRSDSLSETTEA